MKTVVLILFLFSNILIGFSQKIKSDMKKEKNILKKISAIKANRMQKN